MINESLASIRYVKSTLAYRIESVQLPETADPHIDVTSSSANPISGGVVV